MISVISITSYFVEFIFYSFLGWVWESIYCTIKNKEWCNRGFLYGPICPIYGSSVLLADLVFGMLKNSGAPELSAIWIFLICMFGSAIIEFGTHWYLEQKYHATWWDYSNLPFNIQGRICPQVSVGFGLAGVVIVKYILPVTNAFQSSIPVPVMEIIALICAMIFGADEAITKASLSTLLQTIEEFKTEFDQNAEETYQQLADTPRRVEETLTLARENAFNKVHMTKKSQEEWMKSIASRYTARLNKSQQQIIKKINSVEVKGSSLKFERLQQLEDLKNSIKSRTESKK